MNAPLPRSRFGKKFDDNFDRIFRPQHGEILKYDGIDASALEKSGRVKVDDSTEAVHNFEIETPVEEKAK